MNIKSGKLQVYLTIGVLAITFFSCVPARQFEDMKKRESDCETENSKLKDDNQKLSTESTEMKSAASEMQKNLNQLAKDTTELGNANARMSALYAELTKSYDRLLVNNEKLLAGNTEETRKLIDQLNKAQLDLQFREDKLKKDSVEITKTQARVDELESVLRKNDSTMEAIKTSVSNALRGYVNNGLTVHESKGRVYVSMEENLLFASGSTIVEKKGESALKDLAKVLSQNKDISILVEGHTDNVPISGTLPSGAKDNWELSVLRATSVVKIILADKSIEPTRVSAVGRGPFMPIDPASTTEARKKNRRTEIILSPKLDELLKTLDIN
jgi:chemotaxis protein MotB